MVARNTKGRFVSRDPPAPTLLLSPLTLPKIPTWAPLNWSDIAERPECVFFSYCVGGGEVFQGVGSYVRRECLRIK